MNDQAEALRNLVRQDEGAPLFRAEPAETRPTRILTITSGKGGVGKSNFTLNFALQLQSQGYKVLVFDADIGMANIDVLMGASPKYNLYHLLKREKSIEEIIYRGHNDLQFIAGGSGFNDLLSLTKEELEYFTEQVLSLSGSLDFILFDTGAGLTKESMTFITAAEQTIVVTTPEPTSITDAYAIIKMVHSQEPGIRFQLVVNRVTDRKEGQQTADKIRMVSNQFLQLDIPTLGYIPDDANVSKAVKRQVPFSVLYPDSAATRELKELVRRFEQSQPAAAPTEAEEGGGVKRFLSRMLKFMK
ncbi:MinD/ParA family protein [Paenibacillus sp.]|uniref:MinD/ParA family protein n=1 Tax=Paenibacillus sp. TaxID=58172 RepID=UPI002D3A0916|nr:MinD/ParA family protein [Paenibacillus sp.]HZG57871.1 MinD/ParA family protein [Paenibacillus sp.]